MSTPLNSTAYPVYGQLYNFSGVITNAATGNPVTGGLTGLSASISKSDGTFVATTNSPVEIASSSGIFTLDLTAAEMSYPKLVVVVSASNSNAQSFIAQLNPLSLGKFTGRWDAQSVLRFEQVWLDDLILNGINGVSQTGAQLVFYNADGSQHFAASVTQNTTTGTRSSTA